VSRVPVTWCKMGWMDGDRIMQSLWGEMRGDSPWVSIVVQSVSNILQRKDSLLCHNKPALLGNKQHWEIPHMSILAGMARAEHIHNVGGIPYFLCHYPFLTLWWKRMMVSVSCALTALIMTSSVLSWKTLSTPFFFVLQPLFCDSLL